MEKEIRSVRKTGAIGLALIMFLVLFPAVTSGVKAESAPVTLVVGHTDGVVSGGDVYNAAKNMGLCTFVTEDDGSWYWKWEDTPVIVTFVPGVTEIATYAFLEHPSIKSVTIPESVKKIGSGAFYKCVSLTNVTIPGNVETIEKDSFLGCTSLKRVDILNGVKIIEASAFAGCTSLISINIPDSVTSIGNTAFHSCESLKRVNISDGVVSLGSGAFMMCYSLKDLNIGNGVKIIQEHTFLGCKSLTKISIPDSVTTIQDWAFESCDSLKELVIGSGVEKIYEYAFFACNSLSSISVKDGNLNYSINEGVLFDKDATQLICYPAGKNETDYIIPDASCSETAMSSYASAPQALYTANTSLGSTKKNKITRIVPRAFAGNKKLKSVTIPKSVTKIGKDAFKGCEKLTIRGYKNSAAHKYAKNNKIPFKQLFSGKAQITAITNNVKKDETLKMKATASAKIKSVKWTTSDKKIATIKPSGKDKADCTVTGKKKGKKAIITADITFKNGTVKMVKCMVSVK